MARNTTKRAQGKTAEKKEKKPQKSRAEKRLDSFCAVLDDARVDRNVQILEDLREKLPEGLRVFGGVNGLHRALRRGCRFRGSRQMLVDWLDAQGIRPKETMSEELRLAQAAGRARAKTARELAARKAAEAAAKAAAETVAEATAEEWDEAVPDAAPETAPETGAEQPGNAWQPARSREGMVLTTGGYRRPEDLEREREAIKAGHK